MGTLVDERKGSTNQRTVLSHLRLDIDPVSVAIARRYLRLVLETIPGFEDIDSALIIISELVTNVIKYAPHPDTQTSIVVRHHDDRLRVEVHDPSNDLPVPRTPGRMSESGHGLVLVESLAADWGFHTATAGKTVWFELNHGG
jgi:anti-sigma regulatory factor (Ser/Thr protein kinase)